MFTLQYKTWELYCWILQSSTQFTKFGQLTTVCLLVMMPLFNKLCCLHVHNFFSFPAFLCYDFFYSVCLCQQLFISKTNRLISTKGDRTGKLDYTHYHNCHLIQVQLQVFVLSFLISPLLLLLMFLFNTVW